MSFNTSKLDPVYSRIFSVDFGHESLNELCYKITGKYFYFNINEYEGKVIPLSTLDKLIEKEKILNVIIELFSKTGEKISTIYFEDVLLLKIKGLNLDWGSDDIIKIRVKYKKVNMRIFDNDRELKNYQRKQKLQRINKTI